MNSQPYSTVHDAPPDAAMSALRQFDGPVLLDLDETLYLRNSTEDFIDSARPRLLALLAMRLLDLLRPWDWTGGESTRDAWRVRVVKLACPWVHRNWRQRVGQLASQHTNQPLLDAARRTGADPVVATIGFAPIVQPLVDAMGLSGATVVASQSFQDRRAGKLEMVTRSLGPDVVQRCMVITDSPDDLPLLEACARPFRTVWPEARYRKALTGVYLPGQYLSQVKRPGERYIFRSILQEDFAFWVLASVALAAWPLSHVAGLLFLLLSFWTVYECGYAENDRFACLYESQPKLSETFDFAAAQLPEWQAWIWALASGVVGIAILRLPAHATAQDLELWLAVLLATRAWFHLYNRVDKDTRILLYGGLQLARSAAFAVLVPVTLVGSVALGAHVSARWIPYYRYRTGDGRWPKQPIDFSRLVLFVMLCGTLAASLGYHVLLNWTALSVLGWNLYRARHSLAALLGRARGLESG